MAVPRNERTAHRPPSSVWPARLVHFGAIAIPIAATVAARLLLAPFLVDVASRLTHGSRPWMFTAGWATVGFAPAAVLIFLLDGNRRERQLGDNPLDRPREGRGHAVAGRGAGYWIRRLPLFPALLVAIAFAPPRAGGGPVISPDTPGGDSFHHGWQLAFPLSLAALIALLVFRLLAFLPGHADRLLRAAGPLVAAAPALALIGLHASSP